MGILSEKQLKISSQFHNTLLMFSIPFQNKANANFETKTMNKFEIKEGASTPYVLINYKKGVIKLIGSSTHYKPQEFYPTILKQLKHYFEQPQIATKVLIDLDYYNDASFNYIFQLVELIVGLEKFNRTALYLEWYCHPEDKGIMADITMISYQLQYPINVLTYELVG